jgi:hypothetical protein
MLVCRGCGSVQGGVIRVKNDLGIGLTIKILAQLKLISSLDHDLCRP